jgi:hypothetical protein
MVLLDCIVISASLNFSGARISIPQKLFIPLDFYLFMWTGQFFRAVIYYINNSIMAQLQCPISIFLISVLIAHVKYGTTTYAGHCICGNSINWSPNPMFSTLSLFSICLDECAVHYFEQHCQDQHVFSILVLSVNVSGHLGTWLVPLRSWLGDL